MQALVLLYHALDSKDEPVSVHNHADRSVVVPASHFEQQLGALAELGKRVVSLEELLANQSSDSTQDNVVLTFDDGHRSDWSLALPSLLNRGLVATFYVVAGFVDRRPGYLTSAQLRDLSSNGMTIGSHSLTHRFLSGLSRTEVRRELAESRECLEDILGQPVVDFAVPGGHYNSRVIDEARSCGYRSVATCKVGAHRSADDPFRIRRVEIRRNLDLDAFRETFTRGKLLQLQLLEAAKSGLRRSLGLSAYSRIREIGHRILPLNR